MNAVNYLDTPTGKRQCRAFTTVAAQYALRGYALIKADPAIDGPAPHYAMRWGGLVRPLADLDAAGDYLCKLTQADGAGHDQKLQAQ